MISMIVWGLIAIRRRGETLRTSVWVQGVHKYQECVWPPELVAMTGGIRPRLIPRSVTSDLFYPCSFISAHRRPGWKKFSTVLKAQPIMNQAKYHNQGSFITTTRTQEQAWNLIASHSQFPILYPKKKKKTTQEPLHIRFANFPPRLAGS